jgi:hypothetical protein
LPNVGSRASLPTPDDVDPDSLSGGPQTSTDDEPDADDDPKTVVDKERENSFESSRDLDSDDFEPECSFRDKVAILLVSILAGKFLDDFFQNFLKTNLNIMTVLI